VGKEEAKLVKDWMASLNDPNMYYPRLPGRVERIVISISATN